MARTKSIFNEADALETLLRRIEEGQVPFSAAALAAIGMAQENLMPDSAVAQFPVRGI